MFVGRAAKKAAHVFQKAYREKTSTTITLPASALDARRKFPVVNSSLVFFSRDYSRVMPG